MKQLMIDAFNFKKQGYYKQAIELFYKILAKESDNIEILSELGELYYLLENYDRAKHYTNKALEINANHINSLTILRKIYTDKKDYEQASKIANKIYVLTNEQEHLAIFLKLLNIRGKFDEATGFADFIETKEVALEIALSYYNLKKYDDAIEILIKYNNDNNTEMFDLLSKIFFETDKIHKAKEVINKLGNNNIKDAKVLNYMGLSKLEDLQFDAAVDFFKQALEIEPKNDEYNFNLGQTFFLKGWFPEAKKYLIHAICLNQNNPEYEYTLGYVLYREGDYKNALTHLNNDLLDSKVLEMLIKYKTGDLATAKIKLEKLYEENSKNETIIFALSQIYYDLAIYKKAIDMIKKAIEINSKSFEYKSFLANLYIKTNNYDEAKNLIEDLIEKYPNHYYGAVLLAEYQYSVKDFENLFNTAQKLIDLDLNRYEGYYYNALALIEKKDVNFAIESLKKAITLNVNDASLYIKMAEVYQALGQYEDAFEYVKEASDIDTSAQNKELYIKLASILRKNRENKE